MKLFGIILLWASAAAAQVVIGTNSSLPLLSSQIYHAQNGNPIADGMASTLNPPLFGWTYVSDPTNYANDLSAKIFRFQLSTNTGGTFSGLYWDIVTSNNFYNTVPPITNADGTAWPGSNYWRVIYYSNDAATVLSTSAVHHFTIASGATNWDRSMLADSNYLYAVLSQHPHLMFWATNRDAMYHFVLTNGYNGQSWTSISNEIVLAVTNAWWNNENVFTNTATQQTAFLGVQHYLWEAGFVYQLSTNAFLLSSNLPGMMDIWDRFYLNQGFDRSPIYGGTGPGYTAQSQWALAIDYIWPLMNASQRSNAVSALDLSVEYYLNEDWFYEGSPVDTNRLYAFTNRLVDADAGPKGGDSHQRYDPGISLMMCMSIWAESTNMQRMFPYFINYMIGKKDPYDLDEGRGYMQAGFPEVPGNTGPDLTSVMVFSSAKLWLNPLWMKFTALPSYMEPVFYRGILEQWGDLAGFIGDNDTLFHNQYDTALDMAQILNNGSILQQWKRQNPGAYVEQGGSPEYELALPYYFAPPTQTDWGTNVYIDPDWGYAVVSSTQPNAYDSFSNSVGFVTQARPDAHINHGEYSDGSLQLWAYGAQISAGGAGSYARHPMFPSGVVMVNGMGPVIPRGNPTESWYARFTAFTNATDFAYIQSDTRNAFPLSNFVIAQAAGNLLMDYYTTNSVPNLSSMVRNVLFPHHKYLVLYDTMTSSQPYQFEWLWHYMETNSSSVNTNACSFTYTCTNVVNGSNVTVYVVPFVNPSLMTLTNMPGTNNSIINPFTHENLTNIDFYGIPYPRPNGNVWVYNTTATNSWHFGWVVYPAKWGQSAPTITRLDDNTVVVNDGLTVDTNTFGTDYSGPSTFQVNLTSGSTNPVVTIFTAPAPFR